MMGINRHIVLAETEDKARDIAQRAYRPCAAPWTGEAKTTCRSV